MVDNGIDVNHPDLTNQHPISYDSETNSSPSTVYFNHHGIRVSGIIGADMNNTIGITGIVPNCPIMTISNSFQPTPNSTAARAAGINFAWQNGASIINNSWRATLSIQQIEDAINSALNFGRNGLGCVVVFATDNGNINSIDFPANAIDDIIAVGAMSPCGERKNYGSCDGETIWGSNYGVGLDVVAPGVKIPTTYNDFFVTGDDISSYTQIFNGTSAATPHVSGVAALMLSVNSCLTQKQVGNIIEATAQKVRPELYNYEVNTDRPNGTWHEEVGHGLVDAFESVKVAQASYSAALDLYTKDSYNDFGVTPNVTTQYPWLSEDIWVRNQADGLTNATHQNPINNQSNYVYVRVRNKSCVDSDGTETLDLSWAKASISLNYPIYWNGTLDLNPPNNALAGDLVASQTIPIIPAGGEVILEFTWNPPSPNDYSFNSEPWHFCLLSQINTPNDPITPFTNIGSYVTENNNVAWKNLTVVDNVVNILADCSDDVMQNIGTTVAVANPDNIAATFDIKFSVPQEELSNPITTEGKIIVALDEQLYEKWKQGGRKGKGFIELKSPPMSENGAINNNINEHSPITLSSRNLFEITATSSSFDNITLTPNEVRTTSLMVTYPSNPVSEKKDFSYDIIHKRSDSEEIIGGVRYAIQKPNCDLLNNIDAGENQFIKKGCSAALVASPVTKCSSYKWYDDNGKFVSKEPVVKITPNKTTTYTLKYVSQSGCIDEDKVTITVSNQLCKKEREIIKVTPNPASDFITIDYKTANTNSAHVRLLKTDNSIDRTYPLDLQNNQKTINVSDCNFGSYVLMLVCDGINEDSEVIIIQ